MTPASPRDRLAELVFIRVLPQLGARLVVKRSPVSRSQEGTAIETAGAVWRGIPFETAPLPSIAVPFWERQDRKRPKHGHRLNKLGAT